MLNQLKKPRQLSAQALFKKTIICFLSLLLLLNINLTSFKRANAASWTDVQGYTDEAFTAVMIGALTVGAAGIHANEYINDNLELIRQSAKETYNTLAPEVKENFINSINSAGDRINIAQDWLTSALESLTDKLVQSDFRFGQSFGLNQMTFNTETNSFFKIYYVADHYTFDSEYEHLRISLNEKYNTLMVYPDVGSFALTLSDDDTKILKILLDNQTLTLDRVLSILRVYGVKIDRVNHDGTIVDDTYVSVKKRLLDNDLPTGQLDNIYFPKPAAYTPDNVKLRVNDTTGALTLPDGTIYTGDYTWRIPNTKVMEIDGVAVPTTTTLTGDIVNIVTGEVVIPNTTDPPITPPKPEIPKGKLQDFLPLALAISLLDLLRAILYYLARLFSYLITIPMIESVPIPNDTFRWFRNAKILGIEPYNIVISMATFAIGFTVYKVIRRVFT